MNLNPIVLTIITPPWDPLEFLVGFAFVAVLFLLIRLAHWRGQVRALQLEIDKLCEHVSRQDLSLRDAVKRNQEYHQQELKRKEEEKRKAARDEIRWLEDVRINIDLLEEEVNREAGNA